MTDPIDRARVEAYADWLERQTAEAPGLGYELDDEDVEGYRQLTAALRAIVAFADEARDVVAEYREEVIACGWAREYADELAALLARWPGKASK